MKNKIVLVGVLAVMLALIGTVSAVSDPVFIKSQNGGITPSFTYSLTGGGTNVAPNPMTLAIGDNLADVASITVTSNTPYTIKARDAMPTTGIPKPAGTEGKMTAMHPATGAWGTPLTNALNVKWNSGSYVPMSGVDQTIHAGVAGSLTHPLNLKQVVVATDPVLTDPTDYYYFHMIVTGSATA